MALKKPTRLFTLTMREPQRAMAIATLPRGWTYMSIGDLEEGGQTGVSWLTGENDAFRSDEQKCNEIRHVEILADGKLANSATTYNETERARAHALALLDRLD